MTEDVEIILLANAGVLVRRGGLGLLVDGLYGAAGHPFDPVPPETARRLAEGEAPFERVRHLLFTHLHADHFGAEELLGYLHRRRAEVVLPLDSSMPELDRAGKTALAGLEAAGGPVRTLELPFGGAVRWELEPGAEVLAFNTGHLGPQYPVESNYAYLIQLEETGILVTGDAAAKPELFRAALAGRRVDAALVNPMFYQHPLGLETVRSVLRPRRLILYHLPGPEHDAWNLWKLVGRQMERHRGEDYEITALGETLQRVAL